MTENWKLLIDIDNENLRKWYDTALHRQIQVILNTSTTQSEFLEQIILFSWKKNNGYLKGLFRIRFDNIYYLIWSCRCIFPKGTMSSKPTFNTLSANIQKPILIFKKRSKIICKYCQTFLLSIKSLKNTHLCQPPYMTPSEISSCNSWHADPDTKASAS